MHGRKSWTARLGLRLLILACGILPISFGAPIQPRDGLVVQITVPSGSTNSSLTGHVSLMFAPAGVDPLSDYDVTSTPNALYGQNVFEFPVSLSGGNRVTTATGVWGFPNITLNDLPAGSYSVQAFLNQYETVTRSDGSTVSVRFPCGDGAPPVDGYGTLRTAIQNVTVTGSAQTINLALSKTEPGGNFNGTEIGGCSQGNYPDTTLLKHIKIRSNALSDWWGRDSYVGANVLLPAGYDASDTSTRYPVIYSQGHWPGGELAGTGSFYYPSDPYFKKGWDSGIIPGSNGTGNSTVPKFIIVVFRHETPFYDDSYAVNTANIGPYGDALNDELIPYLDQTFNTIAEPYARIQEGGSTGGWESAASLIFRPDLFGVTFSSYPDSLDFHRHQAIPLYTSESAYRYDNGSGSIPSIRIHSSNGTEVVLASVRQENHWELSFGTSSRSFLQWDVWNAVFGVQGYNNYPLEPWDKVTGVVDHEAVEYWKPMDLSNYITSNWDNEKNLGEVLKNRIYIYVGTWDNYYLNEGVMKFEENVNGRGGPGWANVTILPMQEHGGVYQLRNIFNYLELLQRWVQDHAPDGRTPLSPEYTSTTSRGNYWADVLAYGGREAAVARQADPVLEIDGSDVTGSVGSWDPGVTLSASWALNGLATNQTFAVQQGQNVTYSLSGSGQLQLLVSGSKRNYQTETRESNAVSLA